MPKARSWASTARTDRPRVTASSATPAPVMPRPMTTRSTSVGTSARPGVIRCGPSWRERPGEQEPQLGVELGLGDVVVDHRVRRQHEAVGGQQERAGDRRGVAGADRSGRLAGPDLLLGDRQDRVLRATPAGEQVGEQQLGVELDDAQEQLVVAQRADRPDDPVDEARRSGRGRRPRPRPRRRRRRPTRGSSGRPAAAACPTRRGRSSSARRRPGGRPRSASYAASRRRGCSRGRCRDRRRAARAAEPSL